MLYLDSAHRDELAPLLATGLFAGVTTNPKVLADAEVTGGEVPALYRWCVEHDSGIVFVQATGRDVDALRASCRAILELGEQVRVKLVATAPGLTVARELADEGHEVLVTAVYHPVQGAAALAAGARFIAPYVGRADDADRDGIGLVRMLADLAAGTDLRVLAASVRSVEVAARALAAGADDVTVAPHIARAMLEDELTLAATDEFERFAASTKERRQEVRREG